MGDSVIVWGLVFGSIGLGYALYGRQQRAPVSLFAGLALMGVPYFIDGTVGLLFAGALLMSLPFFVKL